MFSKFKMHIMGLAILAVAVVQVFGMRAGFICGCTGQKSNATNCETVACHPDEAGSELAKAKDAEFECGDGLPQNEKDHQHKEVRESLVTTSLPPLLSSPSVVFFDLPPAFQPVDFAVLMALVSTVECPDPPVYGSPPMPQMVARTIVMLV